MKEVEGREVLLGGLLLLHEARARHALLKKGRADAEQVVLTARELPKDAPARNHQKQRKEKGGKQKSLEENV